MGVNLFSLLQKVTLVIPHTFNSNSSLLRVELTEPLRDRVGLLTLFVFGEVLRLTDFFCTLFIRSDVGRLQNTTNFVEMVVIDVIAWLRWI